MKLHRFWRRYTKSVLALLLCGATFTSAHAIEFMKVEDHRCIRWYRARYER